MSDDAPRRADRGRRQRRFGRPPWVDGEAPPWAEHAGPPWAEHGGPPWAGRRGPPWAWAGGGRRAPHRRFGCLFALIALAVMVVFVSGALVVLSVVGEILRGLSGAAPASGTDFVTAAAIVVLGVGIVALVVVGRAARSIARPLDDLVDAAERLESGDYGARVPSPVRGPRGLRDLVRGFNTMASRLEANEEQRRSLLADVSHELRTPLAVLQGNLEAILDGVYPADAPHLEPLLDETRVLARLVEDLRTVTLAEAGTLALHREPTDLGVLASEVRASFANAAAEAGIELVTATDDLPLVEVDPVRIREVLANLVANAIRHTPRGGLVEIRVERTASEVAMHVHDSGAGIAPDLLPHVFERFAKGAGSNGSGLGLAIARGLVEAHGGSIRVASTPESGTTFSFTLPLGEPAD